MDNNRYNVAEFNIVGCGDETAKIQSMFNCMSGDVKMSWNNKIYKFHGVKIPNTITSLIMEFDDTTFEYPIKNNGDYWYRFRGDNNSLGYTNYQLYFDNQKSITFSGKLTLDGQERNGNTFNKSGEGSVYVGEGLSACLQIDGRYINKVDEIIPFNKIQGSQWLLSQDEFNINSSTSTYSSCRVQFQRNPFYHYRVKFDAIISSGDIYYNSKGSIANNKKVSGTYEFIFYADKAGIDITQDMYFFSGIIGTSATIKNIIVEKINPLFIEDYKIKTSGSFTIKDHGFCPVKIIGIEVPSYSKIELKDWIWDNTPIGGHSITGMFGDIILDNCRLIDNYSKSNNEVNFLDEGARGFVFSGANSGNTWSMPKSVIIQNVYCNKAAIPSVSGINDITYRNITVDGFGTYYNDKNELVDLGTPASRPLYKNGGQAFKVDTKWYTPLSRMVIDNVVFKNTSKLMTGASRIWQAFWSQTAFKNIIIKNCRFDTRVLLQGVQTQSQSFSFRHTLDNCEFTEDSFLNLGYGTRILNCKFTRTIPCKNSDGTPNSASNVDYPFPVYTDTKLAAFLQGNEIISKTLYGNGDNFDYNLFDNCLFIARYFYPTIINAKAKFNNCLFENGTIIYAGANSATYDFNLKFIESKRIVLSWYPGVIDLTKKSTSIVELINSEVIIKDILLYQIWINH